MFLGVIAFFVNDWIREILPFVDQSLFRMMNAFALLIAVIAVLMPMVSKVLGVTGLQSGLKTISRRGASGSNNYRSKNFRDAVPEDILGGIVTKFYGLTKELQAEMCIKHIEIWKDLLLEVEIPTVEEKRKVSGLSMSLVASYVASQRNPLAGSVDQSIKNSGSSRRPVSKRMSGRVNN